MGSFGIRSVQFIANIHGKPKTTFPNILSVLRFCLKQAKTVNYNAKEDHRFF